MSNVDDVAKSTQELGGMIRKAKPSGYTPATSSKYNEVVDTHVDNTEQWHTQMDALLKEYEELKKQYYSQYAPISDSDNNERITKFNKQVSDYWDYGNYVKRMESEYNTNLGAWNRGNTNMNRKWGEMMGEYGRDNEKYIQSQQNRHQKSIDQYRGNKSIGFSDITDYYVKDYITRRDALGSYDLWESMGWNPWWWGFITSGNNSNVKGLVNVSRWEGAGYSQTIPAQRTSSAWVVNQSGWWSWSWTMGGAPVQSTTVMGGKDRPQPWGETPGGANAGNSIWYGHGPKEGYSWYNRKQEDWGRQPLKVPFVFYKPFFVDPEGSTTGYMYGWADDRCRVYVNNKDVYGRMIAGGWGGRVNNESGPIKLNKGFNLIVIVAMNLGGPAGMSWTMWNSPEYWKNTVGGNVDYNKKGVLVRTDLTWRCIVQNIRAPELNTYHSQAGREPYSDQNLSLPDFIQKDNDLVKEFQPSTAKRLQAAKNVRYVRVMSETQNLCMQIAQLAVYPMNNQGKNIAQGKPTSCNENSTDIYQNDRYGSRPSNAVDGQLTPKRFPNIYHSSCGTKPWWEVDLQGVYNIAKIVYYNRSDCCQDRSRTLKFQFYDENKKLLWTGSEWQSSALIQTFSFGDAELTAAPPSLPEFGTGYNEENIYVGSSNSNVKRITLPRDNMAVSGVAVNEQNPNWSDRFTASVQGRTLTVRRTDYGGGWGQPLVLNSVTYPDSKPAPPVIEPQEWPTMGSYTTPQIQLLEKISSKSHEIMTLSEKIHTHYSSVANNPTLSNFSTERDGVYQHLTSKYMALLAERKIIEDAITEFNTVLTDQETSELTIDTTRLMYLGWSITLIVIVALLGFHVANPPSGGLAKREITAGLIIVICFAILTKIFGNSHLILPVCIMVLLSLITFMYYNSRGKITLPSPSLSTPGPSTV